MDAVIPFGHEVERGASEPLRSDWETCAKIATLKIASLLTDPVCKVREYFYTFFILDKTCKDSLEKITRIAFLSLGIVLCTILSPLALGGIILRGALATLESKPFIFLQRAREGKALPESKQMTQLSHNQCYIEGGYCLSDGGVSPDKARMDDNIAQTNLLDRDLVNLFEVSDIFDAEYIASQSPQYPFAILIPGVRAVGPSSMMMVLSKYKIPEDSIQFIPFIKGAEVTGRAAKSEKGFLSFDLVSRGETKPFASVVCTHLQHSEIPAWPQDMDVPSRKKQITKIAEHITKLAKERAVIFTGDLNQSESELGDYGALGWKRDESIRGIPTWDGDAWCAAKWCENLWCADFLKKEVSGPLVLDYTFIAGSAVSIQTRIGETGYRSEEFVPKALSDHRPLDSSITFA